MANKVDDIIETLHQAAGTKILADRMARLLILSDDFASLNGAPLAIALWHADPSISKDNALSLLQQFGEMCVEYLDENWDALTQSHAALKSGLARRVPYIELRARVLEAIASDTETNADALSDDTRLADLEWSDMMAMSLETEFGIADLGHKWGDGTTIGQIIAEVDAMVEGYV